MRSAWLTIALAFSSCGGEPTPATPEPASTEAPSTTATTITDPPATATAAEPASPPSAPPVLTFVATPGAHGVAMSVANHGTENVSLRAAVAIEVARDGTFAAPSSPSSLALRSDCTHEADPCVTLAPGAELLPPDWLGTWGDMQCVCTRCGPVEAGDYRLVVTTCDGAHRVESNVFAMPAR